MNLSRIVVVAGKELTDGFRDRRSIYTIGLSSLLGPLLIAFTLSQSARQERAAADIKIPVAGRALAPVLVNWLAQQEGVEIVPGPTDAEKAVRDGQEDFVLVIKEDFPEKFRSSDPAPVQVVADSTRQSAQPRLKRLTSLLSRFGAETGNLRLIVRGISPAVATALKVEQVDVSNAQQRAATLLIEIVLFMGVSVLSAGMPIAADSTAGERERGSLEPLLVNPVPRWQLIAGKWLAVAMTACGGMIATVVITAQLLGRLSLEDLGIHLRWDLPTLLLLVAAMAPLAMIGPAIQIYLSCFAKTFKEAQSYAALLLVAVLVPGVVSRFYPIGNRPWLQPIPVLGQYAMGSDVLGGHVPSPLLMMVAGLEALVLASVFLWLAARLLSRETIIFGR